MERVLEGHVGVITGSSAGIGAATAVALAAAGMKVILGARRAERLGEVCNLIRAGGGSADYVATDMRDEEQVENLIATAIERHGQIDALVNNAAFGTIRTVAEGRTEEWRATLETNVLGTMIACRAALRYMLPRGTGDLLNVTSASAHEAWPYLTAYAASKAAVHTFSQGLRAEVGEKGIRVMTIEVHNVGSTEFASNFETELMPVVIARWKDLGLLNAATPMLHPADVARAVVFQLSQPQPASVHALTVRSRAN